MKYHTYTKRDRLMGVVYIKSRDKFYLYYDKPRKLNGKKMIDIFEPTEEVDNCKRYITIHDFLYRFVGKVPVEICTFRDPLDYLKVGRDILKIRTDLTMGRKKVSNYSSEEDKCNCRKALDYPYEYRIACLMYYMIRDKIDIKNSKNDLCKLLHKITDLDVLYLLVSGEFSYKEILRMVSDGFIYDVLDKKYTSITDCIVPIIKEPTFWEIFSKENPKDITVGELVYDPTYNIYRVINKTDDYVDLMKCTGDIVWNRRGNINRIGQIDTLLKNISTPIYQGIPGWIPDEEYINSVEYFKDSFHLKMLHYANKLDGNYLQLRKVNGTHYLSDSSGEIISNKSSFRYPRIYHECIRIKYEDITKNPLPETEKQVEEVEKPKEIVVDIKPQQEEQHIMDIYNNDTPSLIIRSSDDKYYMVKYDGGARKLRAYVPTTEKDAKNSIRYFYDKESKQYWKLDTHFFYDRFGCDFKFIYPYCKELDKFSVELCKQIINNTVDLLMKKSKFDPDKQYYHINFKTNSYLMELFNHDNEYRPYSNEDFSSYINRLLYRDLPYTANLSLNSVYNKRLEIEKILELNNSGYLQFILSNKDYNELSKLILKLSGYKITKQTVKRMRLKKSNEINSLVYHPNVPKTTFRVVNDTDSYTDLLLVGTKLGENPKAVFELNIQYENGRKWQYGDRIPYDSTIVHDTVEDLVPVEILKIAEYIPRRGRVWLPTKDELSDLEFFDNKINMLMPVYRNIKFPYRYNGWWLSKQQPLLLTDNEPTVECVTDRGDIQYHSCSFYKGMYAPVFIRVSKHKKKK